YFKGEDPIGKRIFIDDPDGDDVGTRLFEVVGIAGRIKAHAFDELESPLVYLPLAQVKRTSVTLLVRSRGALTSLEKPIRETVASIDPTQPVFEVRPMIDRVQETWSTHRLLTS